MSALTDKYSKNFSPSKKKMFEKRVFENLGNMSELSAIMLVLEEMRREGMQDGGIMDSATYEDFLEFMKQNQQMEKEMGRRRLLESFRQYMRRQQPVEAAKGGLAKLLGE
jgi:Zn-dependent peptidase ImmA (M78 family)